MAVHDGPGPPAAAPARARASRSAGSRASCSAAAWAHKEVFWWPAFGAAVPTRRCSRRWPVVVVEELLGAGRRVVDVDAVRARRPGRGARAFWRTGRLDDRRARSRVIAFVRHGQTELNRGGRLQGRVDARAQRRSGATQAAALGGALRGEPVDARVQQPAAPRARHRGARSRRAHGLRGRGRRPPDRARLRRLGRPRARRRSPPTTWAALARRPDVRAAGRREPRRRRPRASPTSAPSGWPATTLVVAVSHVSPIKAAVCVGARRRRARDVADAARPRVDHAHRPPARRQRRTSLSFNDDRRTCERVV